MGHMIDSDRASTGMKALKDHWHKHYSTLPRGNRWTEEIRVDCNKTALNAINFAGDLDAAARGIDKRWSAHERAGVYRDVKPTLDTLNSMGLSLGILSQTKMTSGQLREELESFNIAEYFPVVLTSEDSGYDKPDPRFFQMGSEMMGLKNTQLLYVGNRYHEDALGARSAGITPVLVERRPRHRLRDCHSITDLLSLPSLLKGR